MTFLLVERADGQDYPTQSAAIVLRCHSGQFLRGPDARPDAAVCYRISNRRNDRGEPSTALGDWLQIRMNTSPPATVQGA
jgi:hypothetical protein